MKKKDFIYDQLTAVFRKVFDDEDIVLYSKMKMKSNDILGWDSLSHINLVVAIEKHFGIRFKGKEILWKNVGKIIESVRKKVSEKTYE